MERLKTLRTIVYMICAIFAVQVAILISIIKPSGMFLWAGFGVIAILFVYLARVALLALKELIDNRK
ncbi:MAG: hypothetical protein LIO77_10280 [Rikenellaceae bacterium]|nr:hypothetical protein [Rikenellaceae bacterium]